MKYYLPVFLLFLCSCSDQNSAPTPTVATTQETSAAAVDSAELTQLIRDFFKAFDERDMATIEKIFTPTTITVHSNGVATNTKELIDIIQKTKNWYPRKRKLSDFSCTSDGTIAIVGAFNEVIFSLPDNKEVYEPYNETWIFRKDKNAWHAVRVHYSLITKKEHSEEVN